MKIQEGIGLAIRALTAAMKRDAVSGDGINLAVITKKEFKEFTDKEIEEWKNKLN